MSARAATEAAWTRLHDGLVRHGRLRAAQRAAEAEASPFVRHWLLVRLAEYAAWTKPGVGVAFFPAVFNTPSADGAAGGVFRVRVRDEGSAFGRSVDPRFRAGLAAALEALKRRTNLAGSADPAAFSVEVLPNPGNVEGASLDLAVAVATCSLVLNRPPPADTAYSGVLGGPAPESLRLSEKRAALDAEWGPTSRLAVVGPPATRCEDFSGLDTLLARHFGAPVERAPLPTRAEALLSKWPFEVQQALSLLQEAGDRLGPIPTYRLAARGAENANHGGFSGLAREFEALAARFESRADVSDRALLAASGGIARLDADALEGPDGAEAHLRGHLERLCLAPIFDGTGDEPAMRLFGTSARVASALGRHDEAVELGLKGLAAAPPAERFRSAGDVALWHLRGGDPGAALAQLDAAAAEVAADPHLRPEAGTQAFHDLFRARTLLALGRRDEALALHARLADARPLAVVLGRLELGVALGLDVADALRAFDAEQAEKPDGQRPGTVVSRYRARIERLRGAACDEALAERLAPGATLERLVLRLAY